MACICSRFKLYEELPIDQCYCFVSHRPGEENFLQRNDMFKRISKKFQILYHERVPTKKQFEKEKGVDVDIAVYIVDIIQKAKRLKKSIRIVLVSGDADFKPVVKYATKEKVPIDVWGWKDTISSAYKYFLKSQKVRLFFLDRYLYQIGFHQDIVYQYEFQMSPPVCSNKAERKQKSEIYKSLSHYTVAKRLTEKTHQPAFKTSDFEIFWRPKDFTIAFFREEARNKFETFLREHPNDELVQKLNQLQHQKSLYSDRMQSDEHREKTADWSNEESRNLFKLFEEDDEGFNNSNETSDEEDNLNNDDDTTSEEESINDSDDKSDEEKENFDANDDATQQ